MSTTHTEGYPYLGAFVKSPLNGEVYCRKNGDFLRHLREHNIASYSELIQQLHPDLIQYCQCGAVCSFKQQTMTFISCCGSVECSINARRQGLRKRPDEQKIAHLQAVKQAVANIPADIKSIQYQQRVRTGMQADSYNKSVAKREHTCQARYGDKKYNNAEKISITKQNWTNEQRDAFITNLKTTFGDKWMNDFCTEETWQRRREKLEQLGKLIPLELLPPWRRYSLAVRSLTERVYRLNKHIINPTNLPRRTGGNGVHLDHKIPVAYGFMNDIPIEQIAAVENLQMLHWFDNMSKGKKYDPINT